MQCNKVENVVVRVVMGHPRSLEIAPFDRVYWSSY